MQILNQLIKKFGSYGEHFIVTKNQSVIIFGNEDNDDYGVVAPFGFFQKNPSMYSRNTLVKVQVQYLNDLIDRFHEEANVLPIEQFLLKSTYISAIQDTIKIYNATHIRFYSEQNQIKVAIFDYRKFVNEVTPLIDKNIAIAELIISDVESFSDFTISIKSASFLKLPVENFDIEVLSNGLCGFTSLDTDFEFYFRDQEIQEPVIKFLNEKHNLDISLLFLPTTSKTSVDTNQLLD